jgi:uncharacterized membrane protein YbhN (UPF0104 family)
MNGNITFHPVERRETANRVRAPQASEQECLQAELVEQAELLDARASDIKRLCAELSKESLSASGWMGDLPRYLRDQPRSRHRARGTSAVRKTDLPALDRRGVAALFAVTLLPWLFVALLLYVCASLIR